MNMIIRRKTNKIWIGNVQIGSNDPICVQSMTNTKTSDIDATVSQIDKLTDAGCEIIRVGVPDIKSARAIKEIKKKISIPLVADIHYDHYLALESIKNGADKIRINPGNISDKGKLKEITGMAKVYGIPIRIGVNCGSLEKDILQEFGEVNKFAVFESIKRNINKMRDLDFDNLVISIKSSDPILNYDSNVMISEKYDYPLHIGITESGSDMSGLIRSSIGIGILLKEGIGDTIRVSLSNDPIDEVRAAYDILKSLNIRKRGIEIISCPTCARTGVDLIRIVREVKDKTMDIKGHLKVAVMGCAVNGIGEAKQADIGIAGGKNEFLIFKKDKIIAKLKEDEVVVELIKQIKGMIIDDQKTL